MSSLKEDLRAFMISLLAGFVVYFITRMLDTNHSFFSGIISSNDFIITVIIFAIASFYTLITHKVRKNQFADVPLGFSEPRDIDFIIEMGNLIYFGVKWNVTIGKYLSISDSKPYAKAEPPICPKCDLELITRTKESFVGWKDKYYWYCVECKIYYPRPEDALMREERVIENVTLREFRKPKDEHERKEVRKVVRRNK